MGVHPVPTQCPTTTEFSSQVVRLPRTPAIPIKLITVRRASRSAKPGWEIAFEIQMPLTGSAPLTPQGGRVGKNCIKTFFKQRKLATNSAGQNTRLWSGFSGDTRAGGRSVWPPSTEFWCHQNSLFWYLVGGLPRGRAPPPLSTRLRWLPQDGGLVEGRRVTEIAGTK